MNTVHVIDYGVGNIFNVIRALKYLNFKVELYTEGSQFQNPDIVILPGVGAFGDCMDALSKRNFIQPLTQYVKRNGFLLGICVGMHLLADEGEEFGHHKGLGFIPGSVKHILQDGEDEQKIKIPHVAWATLKASLPEAQRVILPKFIEEAYYFVHSYKFCCQKTVNEVAYVEYGPTKITAVIRQNNVVGLQFHPEKSGPIGLALLQSLLLKALEKIKGLQKTEQPA